VSAYVELVGKLQPNLVRIQTAVRKKNDMELISENDYYQIYGKLPLNLIKLGFIGMYIDKKKDNSYFLHASSYKAPIKDGYCLIRLNV
jgi:hypothetical protein